MDADIFFKQIKPLFGKFTQSQVDGINNLLAESEAQPVNDRELAYIFATVFHETAKTMMPVKEYGGEKYLKSKAYYPYYGRDLCQTTWLANYKKVKKYTGVDVVSDPDLIAEPKLAAKVCFYFMRNGFYTGKKLGDYFNDKKTDTINARRIINGTDKAVMIAANYDIFLDAITKAKSV